MRWTIVLQPNAHEDYMVFSEARGPPKRRLRKYLFALINTFGVSLLGSTVQYVWDRL